MKGFLGFVLRCLATVGLAFLVAPGIARAQATCADRDLGRIGRQDTYVDTVEKRVTVDSATNQKITTYRLRISYKPGPTSSMRICLSKEPSTFSEPLRKPQPLPPVTTEAPPRPPTTVVLPPPQQNQPVVPPSKPGRSCWRTGLCELGLLALAAGGTALGLNCYRFWCRDRQRQEVGVVVITANNRQGRGVGFALSMPFARP